MREKIRWIAALLLSSASIVALLTGTGLISLPVGTQETVNGQSASSAATGAKDTDGKPHQQLPPDYNPYPPGILPSNLNSEIARVLREVDFIEKRALARWRALPPSTLTGQPPTLQNTGTEAIETLGELMNFDRKRYTYSPFFPVLQYNQDQALFFGGNFWDSRSTGFRLRNPDAEQAQHPPVDTQEMGNPDTACIAYKLSQSAYRPLFETVWGKGSLDIKVPRDIERICATPGGAASFGGDTTPVKLKPQDRLRANEAYNHWGQSIDAYEQSVQVSAFSSKFDAFVKGKYTMTQDEMAGYNLFKGKANCNSCHVDGRGTTLKPDQVDTSTAAAANPPIFTCFGSANEGVPLNPRVAFYYQTKPDAFKFIANPLGFAYRDLGMGTFLRSGFGSAPNPNQNWTPLAPTVDGQFQVSTARNVAMAPPQCPTTEAPGAIVNGKNVGYFQKEFFHNGYIKSLKQLVHFYNTRDVYPYNVTSGHCPDGTIEKVNCWPMPEVRNNIDMTTGNLGLTDEEENQIVAFLQTLTDGFTRPYANSDTFTGTCMTGGSAATQGNEFLIPTPPLPPCASAVCNVAPAPSPAIP